MKQEMAAGGVIGGGVRARENSAAAATASAKAWRAKAALARHQRGNGAAAWRKIA